MQRDQKTMPRFANNLFDDFSSLLHDSDEYNLMLWVGEQEELTKFKAHTLILRARSPYFRRALSHSWAKKEGDMVVFKKPNISPKVFTVVLKYLYTGELELKELEFLTVYKLLCAADELELVELINHIQDYLIETKSSWLKQYIVTIMQTSSCYQRFEKLNHYCLQLVSKNADLIFQSADFMSLEESTLFSLLQREDINMDEIKIWQALINWGIGKTVNLQNRSVSEWVAEDFAALEKTLHNCIPSIRYSAISGDDYYEHVMPYKKIIPKHMRKEIMASYLKSKITPLVYVMPPRSTQSPHAQSLIINQNQMSLISSWIVGKNSIAEKCLPSFRLVFRASRDGFAASKFREFCARVQGTVIVVKFGGSDQIVGGYNPSYWDGKSSIFSEWLEMESSNSFTFSLAKDLTTSKKFACRSFSVRHQGGPCFENMLYVADNCNLSYSSWYQDSRKKFLVEDYEVFKVVFQ